MNRHQRRTPHEGHCDWCGRYGLVRLLEVDGATTPAPRQAVSFWLCLSGPEKCWRRRMVILPRLRRGEQASSVPPSRFRKGK